MYKKGQGNGPPAGETFKDTQSDNGSEAGSVSSTIGTDWVEKLAERATEPYLDELKQKGRFIVSTFEEVTYLAGSSAVLYVHLSIGGIAFQLTHACPPPAVY
jgi:hypothetical protein